jgi:hypothetical protein
MALVAGSLGGCAMRHPNAQAPCTAQAASLPAPMRTADGAYMISMNEKSLAGRPERFPYVVVVNGKVVTTVRDSISSAQLWTRSPSVVQIDEVESVNIVDADSALAGFGVASAKRAYVFTTCHARQSP